MLENAMYQQDPALSDLLLDQSCRHLAEDAARYFHRDSWGADEARMDPDAPAWLHDLVRAAAPVGDDYDTSIAYAALTLVKAQGPDDADLSITEEGCAPDTAFLSAWLASHEWRFATTEEVHANEQGTIADAIFRAYTTTRRCIAHSVIAELRRKALLYQGITASQDECLIKDGT